MAATLTHLVAIAEDKHRLHDMRRGANCPHALRAHHICIDVLAVNPKVLWLQQGIRNDEAVKPAVDAGIEVIQDECIAMEYNLCLPSSFSR